MQPRNIVYIAKVYILEILYPFRLADLSSWPQAFFPLSNPGWRILAEIGVKSALLRL
jgi:hypothetical protein